MKFNYKHIVLFGLLGTAGLVSCDTDFLDTTPLTEISSELVWKDGALSEAFVTEIYNGLQQGGFSEQMLASLTDEAVFTHTGRNINTINEGSLSPSNLGWEDDTYKWGPMYTRIRACNMALQNLYSSTSFTDQVLKDRLKGETHFLRAYYYNQLLRVYGSVPLITKVYGLGEDYTAARNTYDECVKFIVKDADSAAVYLDGKTLQSGRATKMAALALKSRVLLHAASDLHDIPTAKAKSSVIAAYANPEFLGYVSGDRKARWTAALAAAKAVVDGGAGYKLNLTAPVSSEEGRLNYISLAMGGGSADKTLDASAASDLILARQFTPGKSEGARQTGLNNGPNGYHNWAGNTPIGLLVDDYQMMDGTAFHWTNPVHAANPYVNRDPRFYASIMYDGAPWKPRDKISGNVDPANQIQTGTYDLSDGKGGVINRKGLDTRSSSIEDWNGSRTGYYMRKFIDPNPNLVDNTDRQNIPWPFFRYTEAVFNYIEAAIETGNEADALLWLNRIRFRAGMPAIKASGADLTAAYRLEKRIEMAYEEQRYYDARRWMIAPATLGRKLTFINVLGKFKAGKTMVEPYKRDESVYNYTYSPVEDTQHENRQWLDKMYFRPFGRDESNRNKLLVQNPGYDK
ncbi:RagB/SusD family nutrient uptake outer membrane protein [Dyadobacter sp. CY356]|uniref:RagB/SusD family nutrient uptake outer membrane protein n=1 Tax=Dyadobacter sp. CY356 TaxID=2906442 RepID=UPI001F335469|nr:RagB/SusD family nutrient uptake outer membrane protein [Dyadobacter sp. CY356]MCF0058129.1 RagB/SusD family nutrient uptake outer membrane protein [Dyadobacter sp. CY356]